jgi:hypothetical protein
MCAFYSCTYLINLRRPKARNRLLCYLELMLTMTPLA